MGTPLWRRSREIDQATFRRPTTRTRAPRRFGTATLFGGNYSCRPGVIADHLARIGTVWVNANTLAAWRWRIQRAKGTGTDVAAPASPPPPFLELVAPPADEIRSECKPEPECTAEPFELVLEDGHRIRVPVRFDPTALRRLVDVLEAR